MAIKNRPEAAIVEFDADYQEIATTPASFQTTPDVEGRVVGKVEAHAVDEPLELPDPTNDAKTERGMLQVTH